jgi:hypothetical protein
MKQVEKYLRRADECLTLARSALTDEHKRQIMEIEAAWRLLAQQRLDFLQRTGKVPPSRESP